MCAPDTAWSCDFGGEAAQVFVSATCPGDKFFDGLDWVFGNVVSECHPSEFAGAGIAVIGKGFDPSESAGEGHVMPKADDQGGPFASDVACVGLEQLNFGARSVESLSERFRDFLGLLYLRELLEGFWIEIVIEVEIPLILLREVDQEFDPIDA